MIFNLTILSSKEKTVQLQEKISDRETIYAYQKEQGISKTLARFQYSLV